MAVNVKMGVDLSGFNSGIREGQNILKGLNAEMKATEAEFKATGNSEQLLANKTRTLNSQLQVQKGIADQASAALQKLDAAGVKPTDAAYQKLYATMMNAQAGMNEAQAALNGLSVSEQQAATNANDLASGLNSIGKKISLDQVISGIGKITSGLENAAKKAVELGEELWSHVMENARLADDILTQATMLDMTPQQYQQYKGYFDTLGEITITEWAAAKRKVEKAMHNPSTDQTDALTALGFGKYVDKFGVVRTREIAENWEDAFWQIAEELQSRVESGKISQELADVYGEAIFGKKYSSLKSLIKGGKEAFQEGIKEFNTASDEALAKDAALNDQVIKLQQSFEALQLEVTSALAPALTDAAKALDGVLGTILEYLKTEEGQAMLQSLGDSVARLFEDIGKIDPASVVESFTSVFTGLVDGMKWIVDNKDTLIAALGAVVAGWAGLRLTGGILEIKKIIDGLTSLGLIGGGASSAAAAGGGAGGVGSLIGGGAGVALAGFLPALQSFLSVNGGPVFDWLMNESPLAGVLNGRQTVGDLFQEWGKNIEKNAESFTQDWNSNVLFRGLMNILTAGFAYGPGGENGFDENEDAIRQDIERMMNEEPFDFTAEPKIVDGAAESISSQVGVVQVAAELVLTKGRNIEFSSGGGSAAGAGGGGGAVSVLMSHANGLAYVPYDGYLARLHKGERVMTAREVQSRSYNSNLYVESMYMNNGTDAEGLAKAMAAAQRRTMSGFGS